MRDKRDEVIKQFMRLQLLINRYQRQNFMDHGLRSTPYNGQGRVLLLLKMKPKITQKELTYLLGMSKQAVAQLLDKLEKNAYITREPSKKDRRVSNIKLTKVGASAAGEINDMPHDRGKVFDCLNDEELDVFGNYLWRIIKYLEKLSGIADDSDLRERVIAQFLKNHEHGFDSKFHGHLEFYGNNNDKGAF